jgi:quercetin dioxygenase-like cupin family protein
MANSQSSKGVVFRPSAITPAERGGGARTYPMVSKRCGSTAMMNGITEFEGGAAIPLHFHNCEEAVMLLEGQAIAEIDGEEQPLVPFEMSWIPAGIPHRFRNVSATQKMRIFWTYASVDATRTLVATGDTRRVDAEHGHRD